MVNTRHQGKKKKIKRTQLIVSVVQLILTHVGVYVKGKLLQD